MKKYVFLLASSFGLLAQFDLLAQVPQLINYQGRIVVGGTNGTNFNGTGQFKFALVNSSASVTYWSNDGSSSAGSQPAAAVALDVGRGLYSLQLGDTGLANMSALPVNIFTNSSVWLRVWFDDGTNGSQLLSPDQRIGAVGYSLMAANVPDALISSAKLADNAVTSSKLANGAVNSTKLVDGSVNATKLAAGAVGPAQLASGAAAANLQAGGQSGIAAGGMILSALPDATNLTATGFSRAGKVVFADRWDNGSIQDAPQARTLQSEIWTGREMIVWGGSAGVSADRFNTGGRYDPSANSWIQLPTNGAPTGRYYHAAHWTGSDMIIWGGSDANSYRNDGARYNPISNIWTPISTNGAPSARGVVGESTWSGTEMLIWGGHDGAYLNTGGRYNPIMDTWSSISTNGAPVARFGHSTIWTGSEMIVWGGEVGGSTILGTGGRYNPASNTWRPVSTTNAPSGRFAHAAVWTGTEMIIWGGRNGITPATVPSSGGRYNPVTDAWTEVSTIGSPEGRRAEPFKVIWTGREMVIWGGTPYPASPLFLNTGALYDPAANAWTAMTTQGAPSARGNQSTVWTGDSMILFGGGAVDPNYFGDTFVYTPPKSLYLYQKP